MSTDIEKLQQVRDLLTQAMGVATDLRNDTARSVLHALNSADRLVCATKAFLQVEAHTLVAVVAAHVPVDAGRVCSDCKHYVEVTGHALGCKYAKLDPAPVQAPTIPAPPLTHDGDTRKLPVFDAQQVHECPNCNRLYDGAECEDCKCDNCKRCQGTRRIVTYYGVGKCPDC